MDNHLLRKKWYLVGINTETVYHIADYKADINKFMLTKWNNSKLGRQRFNIKLVHSLPEPMIIRELAGDEDIRLNNLRQYINRR